MQEHRYKLYRFEALLASAVVISHYVRESDWVPAVMWAAVFVVLAVFAAQDRRDRKRAEALDEEGTCEHGV